MNTENAPTSAPVDVVVSTTAWLRELGAVRPMAPAADEVLVIGKWHEGHYPIMWRRYRDKLSRDFNGNLMNREPIENWYVFGVMVHGQMTRAECERILRQLR